MTKRIPPELQAFIDATDDADRYDNAEDILQAIRTKLEDPQTHEAVSNAWLKRQLELAETEGGGRPFEEVFDRLEKRARDRLNQSPK